MTKSDAFDVARHRQRVVVAAELDAQFPVDEHHDDDEDEKDGTGNGHLDAGNDADVKTERQTGVVDLDRLHPPGGERRIEGVVARNEVADGDAGDADREEDESGHRTHVDRIVAFGRRRRRVGHGVRDGAPSKPSTWINKTTEDPDQVGLGWK